MIRQIKCERVRELLSEYIDGVLEWHLSEIIDDHLLTCHNCAEELRSLEKLVNTLNNLKKVEAPEDFVEKVHERIKPKTSFFDIIFNLFLSLIGTVRDFFTMPRLKLSFQFAAATVMVILTVFSVKELTKQPSHMPSESKKADFEGLVEKSGKDAYLPVEDAYTPPERDWEDSSIERENDLNETIESRVFIIALVINTEALDQPIHQFSERQREVGKKKASASGNERFSMNNRSLSEAMKSKNQAPPPQPMKLTKEERKRKQVHVGSAAPKDETVVSPWHSTVTKIQNLIESVEGSVTTFSYDEHSSMPQVIHALIPARNFTLFLEKLKDIGMLKETLPHVPEQGDLSIPIAIELFFSEK